MNPPQNSTTPVQPPQELTPRHSPETRAKIAATLRGRRQSREHVARRMASKRRTLELKKIAQAHGLSREEAVEIWNQKEIERGGWETRAARVGEALRGERWVEALLASDGDRELLWAAVERLASEGAGEAEAAL